MWDTKRDTDVKNRLLDSVGEGKGGMIWENSIETCIAVCETDDQCKLDAWSRALKAGAPGQRWGMGWEGGGSGVQDGGHMFTLGRFMSMYGKNHYNIIISLQLKEINLKK